MDEEAHGVFINHLNKFGGWAVLHQKSEGLLRLAGNEVHISCSFMILRFFCPLCLTLNDFLHIRLSFTREGGDIIHFGADCGLGQCLGFVEHSEISVHLHGHAHLACFNVTQPDMQVQVHRVSTFGRASNGLVQACGAGQGSTRPLSG